ncbi:MAG: hypothetical protein FMNOHCHN_01985 [Ignavibacteriaceae bacterium]|nr:hypothetical protein [Ignavibacteriaceae bacterium]
MNSGDLTAARESQRYIAPTELLVVLVLFVLLIFRSYGADIISKLKCSKMLMDVIRKFEKSPR